MPVTHEELSRRIRAAREACALTQEDVARRLDLSRSAVAQIERGKRAVSSLELDRLAYLFGRDIRDFVADSFEEKDALAGLFRAAPAIAREPGVADALRGCVTLGREVCNLERILGVEHTSISTTAYPSPGPTSRWEAIQHGERLAEEERRRLGLGSAPLPDLAELLEAQGVHTGLVDLPEDVSGLTLNDPRHGLFVIANHGHHILRRRFSFAHEYAHVLADRDRFGLISTTADRENLIEVRANAFAADFLMPRTGVRELVAGLGKGKPSRTSTEVFDEMGSIRVEGRTAPGSQDLQLYDVVQVAHHFGVSRSATLFRLRNLRLLSATEFEDLQQLEKAGRGRQIERTLGLESIDHQEARSWFRNRFVTLALEAYRREEISRGKLLELAGMVDVRRETVLELLDETGLAENQANFEPPS